MKKNIPKLTFKEEEVMFLVWSAGKPVTALELSKSGKLSINSVKITIPRLLEKGFIEATGFGYSGTTVARTFQAKISAEEYAANQLGAMQSTILNFSTLNFVKQILKNNPETLHDLHELEEMVQKLKEEE